MGCNSSVTSQKVSTNLIAANDHQESVTHKSQTNTSEKEELLVYGWIREQTHNKIPTDLMNQCLIFHGNNEWIRPNIQCLKDKDGLTKHQLEILNHVLICCSETNHQSLYELKMLKSDKNDLLGQDSKKQ